MKRAVSMRRFPTPLSFVVLLLLFNHANGADLESVQELIRKLGSGNFRERFAAEKRLQERPGAEMELRDAMRTADPETQGRLAQVLDYYGRAPVRELNSFAKEGRVDRFIELFTKLKEGKYETDAWAEARQLATTLIDLHKKKGGAEFTLLGPYDMTRRRFYMTAERISHQTKISVPLEWNNEIYYLRAGELDLGIRPKMGGKPQNNIMDGSFVVATRTARLFLDKSHVIFAGGSVELSGGECGGTIVISGGDVTLNDGMAKSLVIARGKITSWTQLQSCRLISGKTVDRTWEQGNSTIISEHDSNPLGFIRWSDPTAKPKAK